MYVLRNWPLIIYNVHLVMFEILDKLWLKMKGLIYCLSQGVHR